MKQHSGSKPNFISLFIHCEHVCVCALKHVHTVQDGKDQFASIVSFLPLCSSGVQSNSCALFLAAGDFTC